MRSKTSPLRGLGARGGKGRGARGGRVCARPPAHVRGPRRKRGTCQGSSGPGGAPSSCTAAAPGRGCRRRMGGAGEQSRSQRRRGPRRRRGLVRLCRWEGGGGRSRGRRRSGGGRAWKGMWR